jgi:hypothetical protein
VPQSPRCHAAVRRPASGPGPPAVAATGRSGGQPARVYRRAPIEVIARARGGVREKVARQAAQVPSCLHCKQSSPSELMAIRGHAGAVAFDGTMVTLTQRSGDMVQFPAEFVHAAWWTQSAGVSARCRSPSSAAELPPNRMLFSWRCTERLMALRAGDDGAAVRKPEPRRASPHRQARDGQSHACGSGDFSFLAQGTPAVADTSLFAAALEEPRIEAGQRRVQAAACLRKSLCPTTHFCRRTQIRVIARARSGVLGRRLD